MLAGEIAGPWEQASDGNEHRRPDNADSMKILTEWRIRVYAITIVVIYVITSAVLFLGGPLSGRGLYDLQGHPLGADFLGFWTAASLAKAGHPTWAYNLTQMHSLEKSIISPSVLPIPWLYPPTFLLILLPIAFIPYPIAIIAWIFLTLLAYLWVVEKIAPHPLTLWLILAFPGTFQNFIHFQNGFFTAALLGGGLLLMGRAPFTAGLLLGLLSYKPHLVVLIPLALIAGRRWRTLAGAGGAAGLLALATLPVMGWETWKAFLANLPLAQWMIQHGVAPLHKMPTVFTGALLAGTGYPIAYILQGIVTLGAAIAVIWVWSRNAIFPLKASALVLAILLATPYGFEYDLVIMALPLAWLGWEGLRTGWLRGEQTLMLCGWLIPMVAPVVAAKTGAQIAPLVLGGLLFAVMRRMNHSQDVESAWKN